MPKVLFWNVQGKPMSGLLASLVVEHAPDLLVLVEPDSGRIVPRLLAKSGYRRPAGHDRFGVFVRPGVELVRAADPFVTDRVEFWRLTPVGGHDWLAAVVHGQDRRNASDGTRAYLFRQIVERVKLLEARHGHRRTIILGDLNANPYEPSVLGANGLHAIGARVVTRAPGRGRSDRAILAAGRLDFFYNPMWRLYGSDPAGDSAAATYYHTGNEADEPIWHMLDQVLIRPEYADRLPPAGLRILTAAGSLRLTTHAGRPADTASDHLPVVFTLT